MTIEDVALEKTPASDFARSVFDSRGFPLVVGLLIAVPIIAIAATRYPTVDTLSELTIYRIGNAVSLLFGEDTYVRPVQGLPIALLSKFEMWAMSLIRPTLTITAKMLAAYQIVYFGALFAVSIAGVVWAWPIMSNLRRVAAILLFSCPWAFGGASISLLIEPDYWVGEWAYLVVSFCLLQFPWTRSGSSRTMVLIGAWLAIGVAMKITLLGIAPLFLLERRSRTGRSLMIAATSFVSTYFLMAVVYMDRLSSALRLLWIQAGFFFHPNASAQWNDLPAVLFSRPFLVSLAATFLFVLLSGRATTMERAAALLWGAVLAYLIWKRPHDTSIASAATTLTFLVAFFIRSVPAVAVALTLVIGGAAAEDFDRLRWERAILQDGWGSGSPVNLPQISGMLFMPDNYWNAGLSVQALGFNGMLGYYYRIENSADGTAKYQEGGKAFQALSPGVVIIRDTTYALEVAERALISGDVLWWTRRDPIPAQSMVGSFDRIKEIIGRAGASIETFKFSVNGEDWLLQKAIRTRSN
jgi:hypothetical protein